MAHVVQIGQPIIAALLEGFAALLHQCPMLLPPDLVHRIPQAFRHMELVESDLLPGDGNALQGGIDIGWPHIHADALKPCQLCRGQTPVPVPQGLFPAVFLHMQHRAGLLIRNNRDVVVTLPMGRLIHPDIGTYLVLPARQTTLYRALHDTVNGGPAQTHQLAHR